MSNDCTKTIQLIQSQIKDGLFANEASVIRGIINPILEALQWPINNVSIVRPEFTIESQRVDLALFHNNQPFIFLEAKKIGGADGAEKQLFQYAFHSGVPILILTDGPTWHFFLTAGLGSYEQRKVDKLDLIEYEDIDQICAKLSDYLLYKNVIAGIAQKNLEKEYKSVIRDKEMNKTLPIAWKRIVEENDDLLFELLANKVEELCNYKPSKTAVFDFLSNQIKESPLEALPQPSSVPKGQIRTKPSGSLGFTRILNSQFGSINPGNRWANLVTTGIEIAVSMGFSMSDLQKQTSINLMKGAQHDRGFKFISKAGLSYQGMDANKTWQNALKLAQITEQRIYVEFEWTSNPNASYPGKKETLYWES